MMDAEDFLLIMKSSYELVFGLILVTYKSMTKIEK